MSSYFLALALLAIAQDPDTTTYADAATEALIVQGRGRHAYQDSLVRDYSASVTSRIDVGFGRSRFARIPPIVAHETAARITWSLPNDLKVEVLGQRAVTAFPEGLGDDEDDDVSAEFDRPWFIPRSLGDSIRMVGDELPSTAALHPLAPGAERFYRYAIVDSFTISVPGRTVRAVGVRVEPKELGPSLIAGDMWFDQETLEVVRMTFVFVGQYHWVEPDDPTPEDSSEARRRNRWAQRIVKLEADLEYALYNRLYWMPYRQLLQVTVDIPWFVNLKIPIRFLTTFDDYAVNQSVLPRFEVSLDSVLEEDDEGVSRGRMRRQRRCPQMDHPLPSGRPPVRCDSKTGYSQGGRSETGGRWEIHYPPYDSLVAYDGWPGELTLELTPEDEERIKETIAALGELEEQLPADWVGRMPRHLAVESFADIYRFNRVQGSSLGAGYLIRPGPAFVTLLSTVRFGFVDRRPTASLTWRRDAPGGRVDISVFRDVMEVEPWTSGLGFGNSLNGIFAGHDDADYYLAAGGGVSFSSYGRGLLRNAEFGLFFERQRTMLAVASSGINDRFGGSGIFPPNTPVAEGDFVRVFAARRSFVGPAELHTGVEALLGGDTVTTGRAWGAVRVPFSLLRRTGELNLRAAGLVGDLVPQMLYRVGGPETVRGFDYPERIGRSFWSAQVDFALRRSGIYSPVVFADIGDTRFSGSDPLVSVGGGLSFLQGIARLNLSKGLRPGRGLRFDLLFKAPR